ncbi:hypothetical protein HWB39_gp26 [Streptomyces phage WRightOn]|uniref:Uncharacterized protein n=1 Tax=Streptomyces phage WRightOn TaxID=2053723 RepID=A0A2H4PI83_9CAUD|nr:hypothetical protein HWB39_gp26 [Streptomyces phage WRightOn]ATW62510.1 hypothetical protein SEA_WRIGHTON_77 [Streptomyces phage WRightOn]WNA15480.1 hypothetical protein SEA_KUMQUAT_73 [Streptomyces phage Kumquat]
MKMEDLTCTCGSEYRSHGDYVVAITFGLDIEKAHAWLDAMTDCLDVALDDRRSDGLERLKEEYGRTVKASADQEGS